MNKVLAIADDLTGAAEIAGIGLRYGLRAQLLRVPASTYIEGLTVFDTNSRMLAPHQASERVTSFTSGLHAEEFDLIYKKVDSALRGHVCGEITVLLRKLGWTRSLLVPQNPSRGRTIEAGIYRIDGVSIDQTDFANDASRPLRSAVARELLGQEASDEVVIGEGSTIQDIRRLAAGLTSGTLPAGGADFFQANLERFGLRPVQTRPAPQPGDRCLFVCGSASAYGRGLARRFEELGVPVVRMPADARDAAQVWAAQTMQALARGPRVFMTIDRPITFDAAAARSYTETLADAVSLVLAKAQVSMLMIEGGETAAAVCHKSGWRSLEVLHERAPGVVELRAGGQRFVIKPGSYQWPKRIVEH